MLIQSFNKVLAATATWVSTTRTLTALGTTTIVDQSNGSVVLASLGTLSLTQTSGRFLTLTVLLKAGAAGAINLLQVGGAAISVTVCAAGLTAKVDVTVTSNPSMSLQNADAVNSATVALSGYYLQQ